MDEVLLLALLSVAGWSLGVIGFFRAGRALREVRRLRAELASGVVAARTGPVPEQVLPHHPVFEAQEPAPGPEALPPPAPAAVPPAPPRRNLEEALTQRFGLWLGAAALLLSAVFLVRFGIEEGWLGPAPRSLLAAVLGLALVAAAERLARRCPHGSAPDLAPAALAAGGVAALFGAAYAAGPLYGLVPVLVAFALLAAAGVAGLLLALRFGPLVGVVGLLGAYVTPMLVATEDPFLPGLYAYLLVVTAAAGLVVRLAAWTPLGALAALGVALWAMAGQHLPVPEALWAPLVFVPAATGVLLFALPRGVGGVAAGRVVAAWAVLAPGLALLPGFGPMVLLEAEAAGLLGLCLVALLRAAPEPGLIRLPWYAAAIATLAVAGWALPFWEPTAEAVTIEGVPAVVLPGLEGWAPPVLEPFIGLLAALAVLHLVAGLWLGARRGGWAGLGAGVPVAMLLIGFARIRGFQPDPLWAAAGLALAGLLVVAAGRAMRRGVATEAGEWAAGAVAALALAAGMLLTDQWLSAALGLLLPALAWIESRTGPRALRVVAAVLAAGVLVRLVLNPAVIGYDVGTTPVLNGLAIAYLVPAAAAGLAARLFGGTGRAVIWLRGVSLAAGIAGAMVLLRHGMTGGLEDGRIAFVDVAAFCGLAWLLTAGLGWLQARAPLAVRLAALRVVGCAAMLLLAGLIAWTPLFSDEKVPGITIWNPLLAGYAIPALVAAVIAGSPGVSRRLARLLGMLSLLAGLAWVVLEVRRLWHGPRVGLAGEGFDGAELWAISGGWLVLSVLLFALGLGRGWRGPRLAALAAIGVTTAKIFVVDMAELEGIWRVLSFLGLGLALIGLGAAYRRAKLPA